MTSDETLRHIASLRDRANRLEGSVNNYSASPSSDEWVSPELRSYIQRRVNEDRIEANRLEAGLSANG